MNEYDKELKRKNIQEFVKKNRYAPNRAQILEKKELSEKRYTDLNRYGFSGFDLKKVSFGESISSELENSNRNLIFRDLKVARNRVFDLEESINNNFKFFNRNISRMSSFLDNLELRLNRLIMLNSKADLFLYGIEETFDTLDKIDIENSTAHIEKGYVTLGKTSLEKVSILDYQIKTSVNSDRTVIGETSLSSSRNLKKMDGSYYKHIVETKDLDQLVELCVYMEFKKETYVGEIKIVGDSIESNNKQYYSISYSTANEAYKSLKPRTRRFSSGENYTSIGKNVKSIKISFLKQKADLIDNLNKRYTYTFSLDSIELTKNSFKKNSESILIAGPYEITNEDGSPVNFNMATIASNTCCIVPEKTSVSFFLSKDKEKWIGTDYKPNKQSSLVKFGLLNDNSKLEIIDTTYEEALYDFIYKSELTEANMEECLFNFKIKKSDFEKINVKNLRIERNLKQERKIYDATGGWFFDEKKSNYTCGFYVDSIEGRIIDFGPNSCIIDGSTVSGVVRINEGYHTFSTSSSNWKEIERDLGTAKLLQEKDELYPYNHRYLIEGYDYINTAALKFSGDKIYLGVGRVFGSLLNYVPREIFYMESNDNNLDIFTVEEIGEYCYFKVRILNNDGSWKNEKNNVIVQSQQGSSNLLYVKAVVKSNDEGVSPHINSFSIRVI